MHYLPQSFVFNRVHDSKVKLKMKQTKYTLEEPKNVAERIKKGTDTTYMYLYKFRPIIDLLLETDF